MEDPDSSTEFSSRTFSVLGRLADQTRLPDIGAKPWCATTVGLNEKVSAFSSASEAVSLGSCVGASMDICWTADILVEDAGVDADHDDQAPLPDEME